MSKVLVDAQRRKGWLVLGFSPRRRSALVRGTNSRQPEWDEPTAVPRASPIRPSQPYGRRGSLRQSTHTPPTQNTGRDLLLGEGWNQARPIALTIGRTCPPSALSLAAHNKNDAARLVFIGGRRPEPQTRRFPLAEPGRAPHKSQVRSPQPEPMAVVAPSYCNRRLNQPRPDRD
jgi:hypothetical protein